MGSERAGVLGRGAEREPRRPGLRGLERGVGVYLAVSSITEEIEEEA